MHFPPRAVPKWDYDQRVTVTLAGGNALMLSAVFDYMVQSGWNEDVLTPELVLAAALDMAVAYIDLTKGR